MANNVAQSADCDSSGIDRRGAVGYEFPRMPAEHDQKGLRLCKYPPDLDQQTPMAIGDETASTIGDIVALNYAA